MCKDAGRQELVVHVRSCTCVTILVALQLYMCVDTSVPCSTCGGMCVDTSVPCRSSRVVALDDNSELYDKTELYDDS